MPFSVPQLRRNDTLVNGEQREPVGSDGRTTTDDDPGDFEPQELRDQNIIRIASSIHTTAPSQSPFHAAAGGPLDPQGPAFNPAAWMKAFYELHLSDQDLEARNRGVAFRNLHVHGYGSATDFQRTVGNVFLNIVSGVRKIMGNNGHKVDILHGLEGIVDRGEMLCVLGPPGSGCSTFLKTIAGETHGLYIDDKAYLNYRGITREEMTTRFRGEATFSAEDDAHLPTLSVGDTLHFAALARSPRDLPDGLRRSTYANHLSDMVMAAFGISHTRNTRVGDNVSRRPSFPPQANQFLLPQQPSSAALDTHHPYHQHPQSHLRRAPSVRE
jgi:ATP-binding cassette, subfamily G (WHITE), member 2, PDR